MDKIKILGMSDSPFTETGFSRQTRTLFSKLAEKSDYDINLIGWNYIGQQVKNAELSDGTKINFKVYSGSPKLNYAQDILQEYIKEIRPEIFYCLLDTFMIHWIVNYNLSPSKFLMYFPSDGNYFPDGCENVLKKSDIPVAMSKFAQKQVADLFNIHSDYIPHSVDMNDIYRMRDEDRIAVRRKFGIPDDSFVLMDVARNQGRKQLPTTIEAFAKFLKNPANSNSFLVIHADPYDIASPWNLINLCKRFEVMHKVIFTGMKWYNGFNTKQMNEIFNLADVRISTTTGEGMGIVSLESMSCQLPQVITNFTTTRELIADNNCGLPAKVAAEITGSWNVDRAMVDVNDFVKQIQILKDDENLRKELGRNGFGACRKYYTWDVNVPKWEKLIRENVLK